MPILQTGTGLAGGSYVSSRGRIVCKPLQYPLIPPQRCGPYIASQRCRGIRGDGVGAYSKKSVRCTKMKTDKIVAIGLKRLKTVLCHCGITDGERPLKETLHKTEIETGTSRRIANGV